MSQTADQASVPPDVASVTSGVLSVPAVAPAMAPGVLHAAGREPAWWTWRGRGVKSVALRVGVTAVVALAAAQVHQHDDPGALCPLRRFTGIPCPFCGSTTVFMEAGTGHLGAAVTANPFTVVAALGFLFFPSFAADLPARFARLPNSTRWVLGGVVLCASWLWQMHRFNLL